MNNTTFFDRTRFSDVQVVTTGTLSDAYDYLKANSHVPGELVVARKGDVNFYAKLPRRNDSTYHLKLGFGKAGSALIHWTHSRFVAPPLSNKWTREERIIVDLAATIDAADATYSVPAHSA
jgi:hypothetical protein